MLDRVSIFKWLGLPEAVATVLLILSIILLLAPYFSGNLGILNIPDFTPVVKKRLKLIGPIIVILCVLFFLPTIRVNNAAHPTDGNSNTSIPTGASSPSSSNVPIPPLSAKTPPELNPADAAIQVWVNTDSGVYHCPNTHWFGNTKKGKYVTQGEALAEGNRPAYGKRCHE
jgi:hypothetical protein